MPCRADGGPSQAYGGPYQANTESSEANARSSQVDGAGPLGLKEDLLRLTETTKDKPFRSIKGSLRSTKDSLRPS